eukprot:gnl/Hemi2/2921_TR1034_c0_g9_i1.p1 gnl/Hemi2/2921_TR1034_c0_g9~~gnl/Hemi2/2921_TR1034_c0_g9_i1.p1  ORF type:complete len:230 (-),score=58.60 gnl/Hemi2/2921_TR1034_c0_g9_i1:117-806(-)
MMGMVGSRAAAAAVRVRSPARVAQEMIPPRVEGPLAVRPAAPLVNFAPAPGPNDDRPLAVPALANRLDAIRKLPNSPILQYEVVNLPRVNMVLYQKAGGRNLEPEEKAAIKTTARVNIARMAYPPTVTDSLVEAAAEMVDINAASNMRQVGDPGILYAHVYSLTMGWTVDPGGIHQFCMRLHRDWELTFKTKILLLIGGVLVLVLVAPHVPSIVAALQPYLQHIPILQL